MSVIIDIFVFFVSPQRADFQNLAFWAHFLKGESNIIRKSHTVAISWKSVNRRPIFRKKLCNIFWELQSPASMDFRIFCAFIHIQTFPLHYLHGYFILLSPPITAWPSVLPPLSALVYSGSPVHLSLISSPSFSPGGFPLVWFGALPTTFQNCPHTASSGEPGAVNR